MSQPDYLQEPELSPVSHAQKARYQDSGEEQALLEYEAAFRIEHADDEPQITPEDVEHPDPDNRLATDEAMVLYSILAGRPDVLPLNPQWNEWAPPRPLYDWFVNAINIAPMCDLLIDLAGRLAARRRTGRNPRSRQRDELFEDEDAPLLDWNKSPGLRV